MYKNKVINFKIGFIYTITDSMIPVDGCQKNASVINFTTDDMTSKFGLFLKDTTNHLYLTESM